MSKIIKEIQYGDEKITIETGEIARQATGSVVVSQGGTVVLVTVVGKPKADPSRGFFPLTVNYQEKMYATGRIPGGFFKREGRPSEQETLICRLIDRPIRPLFPEGFMNEVQIVATLISLNTDYSPDILAMIGASAALAISGMPFNGPIGAARVGYQNGTYQLNPSPEQAAEGQLDLIVAGTEKAILMVESQAKELSEEVMLGAVLFGHEMMQTVIRTINELADEVGKAKWDWQAPEKDENIGNSVKAAAGDAISQAYSIQDKESRYAALEQLRQNVIEKLVNPEDAESPLTEDSVVNALNSLQKAHVREQVLSGQARIDGRDLRAVRPISVRTGVLPRVHGSALFTRGETQAIVVATLGSDRDSQIIDSVGGEYRERFMMHYNFPPYCVGETGMIGSPKRREIGHGNLARRGIKAVLPTEKAFPYVLRVVSEITESNGSSSMASVCGTSLALMDAGVPLSAPVSGIAMGLVKEGERYAILSDILGDEDHLGDMDFKVAGSANGITALQMDIKIDGITKEIMQEALEQANEGRLHILGIMNNALDTARTEMSEFAPRIETMKIHQDKIRDVIGRGGSTIRSITDETGVTIDISEDGTISLFSPDGKASKEAMRLIKRAIADVEVGEIFSGRVQRIVDFGAFVNLPTGKDGLVHISEIAHERVQDVRDHVKEGEDVQVKVIDIDQQGRVKLSIKALKEVQEKQGNDSESVAQEANKEESRHD